MVLGSGRIFWKYTVQLYTTAMPTFTHYLKLSKIDIDSGYCLIFRQDSIIDCPVQISYWLSSGNAGRKKRMHLFVIMRESVASAICDGTNSSGCGTNIVKE